MLWVLFLLFGCLRLLFCFGAGFVGFFVWFVCVLEGLCYFVLVCAFDFTFLLCCLFVCLCRLTGLFLVVGCVV